MRRPRGCATRSAAWRRADAREIGSPARSSKQGMKRPCLELRADGSRRRGTRREVSVLLQPGHRPPDGDRRAAEKRAAPVPALRREPEPVAETRAEPAGHSADADRPAPRPRDRRTGPTDVPGLRDQVHGVPGRGPARLPATTTPCSARPWSRCSSAFTGRPGTTARRPRTFRPPRVRPRWSSCAAGCKRRWTPSSTKRPPVYKTCSGSWKDEG